MIRAAMSKVRRLLLGSNRARPEDIARFNDDPANPYLVSFPRTGSHWLRVMMELYFRRPLLVHTFFFPRRRDYLLLHTHDLDLEVRRENVVYLYRDPVDTVYSQLKYEEDSISDVERIAHWAGLYGQHLDKWLHVEQFTRKKTVVRYDRLRDTLHNEFAKLCEHFGVPCDGSRLDTVAARASKNLVKEKTRHDPHVINTAGSYEAERRRFRAARADLVWRVLLKDREHLREAF